MKDDPGEFSLSASEIIIHPDYDDIFDGSSQNMDYCLLKFDENLITFNGQDNVKIACLPEQPLEGGEACWVAGWGTTSYQGELADTLQDMVGLYF